MEIIIIIGIILLSIPAVMIMGIYIEKNLFNNGKCKYCDIKFKFFDYDSHSCRGYQCPKCGHTVWISYHSVDKKFKE